MNKLLFSLLFSVFSFLSSNLSSFADYTSCSDSDPCSAGLFCDTSVNICVSSMETACSDKVPCPVGNECYSSDNVKITSTNAGNGTCRSSTGSIENNAFTQVFCNLYLFMTGKTARIIGGIVIAIFGVGVVFGKLEYKTLIIMFAGFGALFGAPAIVALITSKGFTCI